MNLLSFIKNSLRETKEYSNIHNIYEEEGTSKDISVENFTKEDFEKLYNLIKNGRDKNDNEVKNIVKKLLGKNGENNERMKDAASEVFDSIFDSVQKQVNGDKDYENAKNASKKVYDRYKDKIKTPDKPDGFDEATYNEYYDNNGKLKDGKTEPKEPKKPGENATTEETQQYENDVAAYKKFEKAKEYAGKIKDCATQRNKLKDELGEAAYNSLGVLDNLDDTTVDWEKVTRASDTEIGNSLRRAEIKHDNFSKDFVKNAVNKANNNLQTAANLANLERSLQGNETSTDTNKLANKQKIAIENAKKDFPENFPKDIDELNKLTEKLGISNDDLTEENYKKYRDEAISAIDKRHAELLEGIINGTVTEVVPAEKISTAARTSAIIHVKDEIGKDKQLETDAELARKKQINKGQGEDWLEAASIIDNENNFTEEAAKALGITKEEGKDYTDEQKAQIKDWQNVFKTELNAADPKKFNKDNFYNKVKTKADTAKSARELATANKQLAELNASGTDAATNAESIVTKVNELRTPIDSPSNDQLKDMKNLGILPADATVANSEQLAQYNRTRAITADSIVKGCQGKANKYQLPQGESMSNLMAQSLNTARGEMLNDINPSPEQIAPKDFEKYQKWAKGEIDDNCGEVNAFKQQFNDKFKTNPGTAQILAFKQGLQKHAQEVGVALKTNKPIPKLEKGKLDTLYSTANTTTELAKDQEPLLRDELAQKIYNANQSMNAEACIQFVNNMSKEDVTSFYDILINGSDKDKEKLNNAITKQLNGDKPKSADEFIADLGLTDKIKTQQELAEKLKNTLINAALNKSENDLQNDYTKYCQNNGIYPIPTNFDNDEGYANWKTRRAAAIESVKNDTKGNIKLSDFDFTQDTAKLTPEKRQEIAARQANAESTKQAIKNVTKDQQCEYYKNLLGDDFNKDMLDDDGFLNPNVVSDEKLKTKIEKYNDKAKKWLDTSTDLIDRGIDVKKLITPDLSTEEDDNESKIKELMNSGALAKETKRKKEEQARKDFDDNLTRELEGGSLIPNGDARYKNAKIEKDAEGKWAVTGVENEKAKEALQKRVDYVIRTREHDKEAMLFDENGNLKSSPTVINDKFFQNAHLDIPSPQDTKKIEAQELQAEIDKKINDSYSNEVREKRWNEFCEENDIKGDDKNIAKYKNAFDLEWSKAKQKALDSKDPTLSDGVKLNKDTIVAAARGKSATELKQDFEANEYETEQIANLNNKIETFNNDLRRSGFSDSEIEKMSSEYKSKLETQIHNNAEDHRKNGTRLPSILMTADEWYQYTYNRKLSDEKKNREEQGKKIDVIDKEQIPDYWNKLSSSIDRIHKNAINKYKNSSEYQDADPSVQSALLQKFEARLAKTKGDFESRTAKGEKIPMAEIMNINTLTCDDEDVKTTIDKMSDRAKEKQKKLTDLRHEKEAADDKAKETRRKATDEIFNILGKVPIIGIASGIIKNIVDVTRSLSDAYTGVNRADMDKDDLEKVLNKNMDALHVIPVDDTMEDFKDLISAESPKELVQAVEDNKDIQKTIGEQSKSVDFKGIADAIEQTDTEKLENAKKEIVNIEQESANIEKNIKDTENQISHIKKSITAQEREDERTRLYDKWVEEHPNDDPSEEFDRLLNLSDEELDDSINNKDDENTSNKDDENENDNEETENEPEEDDETEEKTEDCEVEENGKTVKYTFHSRPSKRDENELVYTYDRQVDGKYTAKGASITKKEIAEIKSRMKKNNENDDEETENEPEETKESVLVRYIAKTINENAKNYNINLKNYIRQNILF